MKIAQLVITPVYKAKLIFVKNIESDTERGKKALGQLDCNLNN